MGLPIFVFGVGLCQTTRSLQDRSVLLNYLELEIEFLASKDSRKIELPKLSREAKRRPSLVKIHDQLKAQRAPQICETHVSFDRLELC